MKALISVSDKTGIIELAKALVALNVEIISTGGTESALVNEGIKVTNISDVTSFPECLDGRVKTLHPNIHGGILAVRDNKEHIITLDKLGISPIDIVIVNLYPFKKTIANSSHTLADAIENIDIGGPSMIRAAAKNYSFVTVVVDPSDYSILIEQLENGGVNDATRFSFAVKAFEHTAAYDSIIASYLRGKTNHYPEKLTLTFELKNSLRYGENQHQSAAFYGDPLVEAGTIASARQIHGKELSYNNIGDADGAIGLLKEFDEPTVVVVKHATPCGVASAPTIYEAFMKAYEADKVSIFGGIIAANCEIDENTAKQINNLFIEIVAAPSFSERAKDILTEKKNIRLLEIDDIGKEHEKACLEYKKVRGGLLVQEADNCLFNKNTTKCVTKKQVTEDEISDLSFAFKIVKHVKSNAIVIAKNKQSLGIGAGQTSRIKACMQAIGQGREISDDCLINSVMASDAFFPMEDCVIEAAKAGVSAIIQPGGSVGDDASIAECDKNGIAMVFTGIRHFKH